MGFLRYFLPLIVIAEMLGVPVSDHHYLRELSDASIAVVTPAAMKARYEMWDYFTNLAQQRQKLPGKNLISSLIVAHVDGRYLTNTELVSLCCLLLTAGNETTKSWIGNAMACFDQHPDALAQVQAQPDLIPMALEEVLRYLPPIKIFPRVAAVDTVIDRQEIKAGQWVIPHIDAANRDETQFPDPETFDIRRTPNRHLTFGHGIHFCLGAPLARLETKIALTVMLTRLCEIERVHSIALETIVTPLGYGFKNFPIRFKRK
ncbi:MAG: cytochrome P450 [Chloroflexi bacterium]|nr:MAG: cytochrome P450 [Chloroflexota bacterium]